MASRRTNPQESEPNRRRRATTPEGRENQIISDAYDLAERQIREGTASAQVITHFLKMGSTRERLEKLKIQHENELLETKREAMKSAARSEEMFERAIKAMRSYQGLEPVDDGDGFDDQDVY